jgi:hypothetical protein
MKNLLNWAHRIYGILLKRNQEWLKRLLEDRDSTM